MISFIVPAFNEAPTIVDTMETIRSVVSRLHISDYEIIPIDDGSDDGSRKIMEELAQEDDRIKPIYHTVNQGLGKSVTDGVQKATKPQFVVVPGDNDICTDSLFLMLQNRESAEMIMSIPINKEIRPIGRQIVSTTYQLLHNIFFGTSIGYLNGPGVWPTEHVKKLELKSNRFSIISEMNIKLLRTGVSFAEVPIYLQADEPVRSTINLKNLLEVMKVFMMLFVDLNLKPNRPPKAPVNRVKINFSK